jgi:F420-dependent oxidoreductase-like protein
MRFGLQLETYAPGVAGNEFDAMLAVARLAEEVGFASVWYEDHFMWRDDECPETPSPQLECLMTLAALAAATERVELGMLVLGVPYRNPALVAKMLATLDVISHGRVIAGLGAAWHEQEFAAYGWPFPGVRERLERLEEVVQIVDRMLTERPASFRGDHYAVERALNDPPPVRRPRPPILIGGNGERRTLRLVARYADLCNVYGSVEDVARKFAALRRHCEEVGRPYEAIARTINFWLLLARDEAERAAQAARFPRAFSIDTPEETVGMLKAYEAAGAQYAIVKLLDAGDLAPVRLFAETVLPAFAAGDATPD